MSELSAQEIAELIEQVRESDFVEVRIELGDLILSISRRPQRPREETPPEPPPPVPAEPPAAPPPPEPDDTHQPADDGLVVLRSPVLGTFYSRPSPEDGPFVEPGSEVAEDSVVGIVEVMKLMNHITAQTAGRVETILVEDGQLVEYDQPLLTIRPA